MPDLHLSTEINRPAEDVFNLVADLAHYSRWLPPSKTYMETSEISDTPIKQGTTYVDKNTSNTMHGEIREFAPYSRIVFHQTSKGRDLDITARYDLSPHGNGTHLARTVTISTAGILRLLQPIVVSRTRQENLRLLDALKAHLEATAKTG